MNSNPHIRDTRNATNRSFKTQLTLLIGRAVLIIALALGLVAGDDDERDVASAGEAGEHVDQAVLVGVRRFADRHPRARHLRY